MPAQCALTGWRADSFLAAMTADRSYRGASIRDAAIADNVEWIARREDKIVLAAHNGHIQRWPLRIPPVINDAQTMAGQHIARALGDDLVVIGTAFGGGELWSHRPVPGGPPGHTEPFTHHVGPWTDGDNVDALLAQAVVPLGLLDLRTVPRQGAVADRFAALRTIMSGPLPQLVYPLVAFDALVYIDTITPWHTWHDAGRPEGSGT